jgi:hypothetical protein
MLDPVFGSTDDDGNLFRTVGIVDLGRKWSDETIAPANQERDERTHGPRGIVDPLADHILLSGFSEIHEHMVNSCSLSEGGFVGYGSETLVYLHGI